MMEITDTELKYYRDFVADQLCNELLRMREAMRKIHNIANPIGNSEEQEIFRITKEVL